MHTERSTKGYGSGVLHGFPSALIDQPAETRVAKTPPRHVSAPLRKRATASHLVALLLGGIASYGGLQLWQAFIHHDPFGTVVGRTLEIHSPHSGIIRRVYVDDGNAVRQGERLFSIDKLVLRQQLERLRDEQRSATARLEPANAKSLEREIRRVEEQLALADVSAPVDGIVLERHRVESEYAADSESVLTLLDTSTLKVVVYVRQHQTRQLSVGDLVWVEIRGVATPITCRVDRIEDRYRKPPPHIRSKFYADELLLPVHLTPLEATDKLRVGAVARLLPERPLVAAPARDEATQVRTDD